MSRRVIVAIFLAAAFAPLSVRAQGASSWRAPGDGSRYGAEQAPQAAPVVAATPLPGTTAYGGAPAQGVAHAQVTKGAGTLPNDHGQVWREYDITPYTIRNTTTAHPEQAIVD